MKKNIKEILKSYNQLEKDIQKLRGYEPRCKVCNSHLKGEIEQLRIEHKISYRKISDSLKTEGVYISHNSLSRHFKKHVIVLNLKKE